MVPGRVEIGKSFIPLPLTPLLTGGCLTLPVITREGCLIGSFNRDSAAVQPDRLLQKGERDEEIIPDLALCNADGV